MILRFRDWPLRWKLLVPPGLVVVAAMLAGALSYHMSILQRQEADDVRAMFSQREQNLTILRNAILKTDLSLFRMITWRLVGVGDDVGASLVKVAVDRLEGVEALTGLFLQAEVSDPRELPFLEAIHKSSKEYEVAARRVLGMLDTDYGMALTDLAEAERRYAVAEAGILDWETYLRSARERLELDAAAELDQTIGTISLMVGVVFVLAVTVVLGRAISGGVYDVIRVMERLAAGDKSVAVPETNRGDEIGAMIRSVAVFKETAQALDRLAEERAREEEENRVALAGC